MRTSHCVLSLLLLVAVCLPSTAAAAGPSVTGGGLTKFEVMPGLLVVLQLSVNAVEQGNGTVSGHLNYKVLSPDFGFEIYGKNRVSCLRVVNNVATLSGVSRKGVDQTGVETTGKCWVAWLWDWGQGVNAPPDAGNGPHFRNCAEMPGGEMACLIVDTPSYAAPMATGNIRVRP